MTAPSGDELELPTQTGHRAPRRRMGPNDRQADIGAQQASPLDLRAISTLTGRSMP